MTDGEMQQRLICGPAGMKNLDHNGPVGNSCLQQEDEIISTAAVENMIVPIAVLIGQRLVVFIARRT